jgi:hypothetical protein
LFDRFALSTGYQPYVDPTVGAMNHQWDDAQVGQGSPDAFDAGLKLAQQGSSASSGPAPQAEEGHPQFQGQPTFSSLGAGTGAGGNFCDLGQVANGYLGKISGQEFQGKEVVMEDVSMSGAHPMYDRPMVVEGPYAAVKGNKGTKAFDVNPLGDEERLRKAEYEDLKVRLEAVVKRSKKLKIWVARFQNMPTRGCNKRTCCCKAGRKSTDCKLPTKARL